MTGPIVLDTFRQAVAAHGIPASTLTDNGMVFTTRLSGGRNALEHELRRLHITQKNAAPNHPTTCGKVERFQQTMKNWLRAQPDLKHSYTTLGWPTGYVTWAPDETTASCAAPNFPEARFEATDLDRSWTLAPTGPTATGPGHALLAWLVGCGPDEDLGLKRTADATGVAAPADTGLRSRSPDE
ncbi:hypothetical protein ABZ553_03010 [Streptomyces sparsogenes]|uniref:hypothetical protein n=1 Tax=Streptomyces sparsogenes TaxID=67365 RepID=UPI0033D8CD53